MSTSIETENRATLSDLPGEIIILLLSTELDAWDVLNCLQVCRAWREVFSTALYLQIILRKYPGSRESRLLSSWADHRGDEPEWKRLVICVGRRYHNLGRGKARKIDRYTLQPYENYELWHPVGQWDYHLSQPGGRLYFEYAARHVRQLGHKPFLFRSTLWSYDDGLIACAPTLRDEPDKGKVQDGVLSIIDLETRKISPVEFSITGKVIRNITFRNRALVIEWAESNPFHALNESDEVHRHFATCFDVTVRVDGSCKVTLRNEWKLHFLGLPLNLRDRFLSVHNGQHYAVYFWQPNRSMYTGDEDLPIEALFVWDISVSSPYLPSLDPGGRDRPPKDKRPHPVSVFSFRELDFLGIRQHSDIKLMSMHIDSSTLSLTVRENVCVAGQGYFDPAERLMCTTTTTFPFQGAGPAYCRRWQGDLPPYRGHCSTESVELEDVEKWFLPVMDVYDDSAGVRFSLVDTCFTGLGSQNKLIIRMKSRDQWTTLDDELNAEVVSRGRIAGDERWLVGQNSKNELVVVKF